MVIYMEGMPNLENIDRVDLILSANRALLGEVRPNMRRVCIEYLKNEKKMILYFFYDSPPTQEELDYDVEGTISVEMSCDFPEELNWEEKSFVLPYPAKIPDKGISVFRRYEPSPPDEQNG